MIMNGWLSNLDDLISLERVMTHNFDVTFKPLYSHSSQVACDMAVARNALNATVVLRGGTHSLAKTLMLDPKHSGLSIMAYPGESPVLSGGVKLNITAWKKVSDVSDDDGAGVTCRVRVGVMKRNRCGVGRPVSRA